MFIKNHSWQKYLESEFNKDYFINLMKIIEIEYEKSPCFPRKENIFAAFEKCSFDDLKVVIIGQDPYHGELNGICEANGMCFSVNDGIPQPPSLKNIFKELETDLKLPIPSSGNLEKWANQGVLLLNTTLTVRKDVANSHKNLDWSIFTDEVIRIISKEKENVVFLLWGGFAKKKKKLIDIKKHIILESGHPSPLSANKGHWFKNQHFSKTNSVLKSKNIIEINW